MFTNLSNLSVPQLVHLPPQVNRLPYFVKSLINKPLLNHMNTSIKIALWEIIYGIIVVGHHEWRKACGGRIIPLCRLLWCSSTLEI